MAGLLQPPGGAFVQYSQLIPLEELRGPAGKSNYEIAVANGFIGTEADWLATLVGPPGPATPGPAGASAYDTAVANGFVGTETQWLASLQGSQGPQGLPGVQGDPGDTGPVGPAGPEGVGVGIAAVDYGVVADGTTDNAAALNAAIAAAVAQGGRRVQLPAGNINVGSTILINGSGVRLTGESEKATNIRCTFAAGDIIAVGDGTTNPGDTSIENMSITSTVAKTSGAAIRFRNGHNLKASNIRINSNMYYGFQLDGGAQQFLYYIENFEINSGVRGIVCGEVGFPQDIWISDGIIASCTDAGIFLKHCSGWYFDNVDAIVCGKGLVAYPSAGERVVAGFLNAMVMDTSNSHGFAFVSNGGEIAEINMSTCWGSTNGTADNGHGLYTVGNVKGLTVGDSRFINNKGHGILLGAGSEDITIANTHCLSNSQAGSGLYHGLSVGAGVSQWSVTGGVFGQGGQFATNNQGWGILVNAGASNNYTITATNLLGNVTGSLSDGGTGTSKHIIGNIGYLTSNKGIATIAAGTSTVNVNHGLSATPAREEITLTPIADPQLRYWVSAATSTQFTITMSGNVGLTTYIGWNARIKGA